MNTLWQPEAVKDEDDEEIKEGEESLQNGDATSEDETSVAKGPLKRPAEDEDSKQPEKKKIKPTTQVARYTILLIIKFEKLVKKFVWMFVPPLHFHVKTTERI